MKAFSGVIDKDAFFCLISNCAFQAVVLKEDSSTVNELNSYVSNGETGGVSGSFFFKVNGRTIARITPIIKRIIKAPQIIFFFLALAAS